MTAPSAWPGTIQTGAVDAAGRRVVSSTTSTMAAVLAAVAASTGAATPSSSAVAGLMRAALSQVSLVIGLGSSCSQPLLANRPSKSVGSGRKTIS